MCFTHEYFILYITKNVKVWHEIVTPKFKIPPFKNYKLKKELIH
jgi:hypothetical protein